MTIWTVRHVVETGSTNADLLAVLDDGTHPDAGVDHLVLRTDHQTAGRGRLDRRWEAPPGSNLLVSLLFRTPPDRAHVVTQTVGLAALRAVDRILAERRLVDTTHDGSTASTTASATASSAGSVSTSLNASLKWPNDLLLGDLKLAGILAQRHATGPVVVGLGLNVGWAPDGATSLAAHTDPTPTPAELLGLVLEELAPLIDEEGRIDAAAVGAAVRNRMSTIGAEVRVDLPGGAAVTGRAVGLEDDGSLLVDVAGRAGVERRRLDVGDVVHLRTV